MTSVIIPNSVTKIGDGAFQGCIGLVSVSIPNDVTSIGRVAFKGCTNLTKVILPPNIDTKILDEEYFMWTKYLNNIGDNAFVGCKNIEDVFCYSNQLPKMGDNVFGDAYVEYATLHVPASSIESYMADSQWGTFGTIVALTDEEMAAHIENITVIKDGSHIYTIDGKPLEALQKGVNIIKYMSGMVKKVMVK